MSSGSLNEEETSSGINQEIRVSDLNLLSTQDSMPDDESDTSDTIVDEEFEGPLVIDETGADGTDETDEADESSEVDEIVEITEFVEVDETEEFCEEFEGPLIIDETGADEIDEGDEADESSEGDDIVEINEAVEVDQTAVVCETLKADEIEAIDGAPKKLWDFHDLIGPCEEKKLQEEMAKLMEDGMKEEKLQLEPGLEELATLDKDFFDMAGIGKATHEKRLNDLRDLGKYIDETEWMYPPIEKFIPFNSDKKEKKTDKPCKDPFFPSARSLTNGIINQSGIGTSNLKMRIPPTVEDVLAVNLHDPPI